MGANSVITGYDEDKLVAAVLGKDGLNPVDEKHYSVLPTDLILRQ